jgi:hypothetical protein
MKNDNAMRMISYGRQDRDRWPASKAALELQLCLCIAIDIGYSPAMAVGPWRQSALVVVPLHCH